MKRLAELRGGARAFSFLHTAVAEKSGSSLVELMVAAALSTTVVLGVVNGVVSGTQMSYLNAQHMAAFGLCQDKLEQIREMPFGQVTESDLAYEPNLRLTHCGSSNDSEPVEADRTCTVTPLAGVDGKAVTVTVTWGHAGDTRKEELAALVFKK